MKIEDWRNEIDSIDAEIVNLINRRVTAAKNIGEIKAKTGLPIIDLEREDDVLRKIGHHSNSIWKDDSLILIYKTILQKSRQIQVEQMSEITRKTEKGIIC
jgi:chorismate mutase